MRQNVRVARNNERIKERIKELRTELGITQPALIAMLLDIYELTDVDLLIQIIKRKQQRDELTTRELNKLSVLFTYLGVLLKPLA